MRIAAALIALLLVPSLARARQAPGGVAGTVSDSIANAPLAGALVQLVGADGIAFGRATTSGADGRFVFDSVPPGRYQLGFHHALLDSLGVEAPLRGVTVEPARRARADLAIPSAARIRAAVCGPRATAGALVIGFVRDARTGEPVPGAGVTGEWLELTFRRGGVEQARPRRTVTTGENGWFALCDAPSGGTMLLGAGLGADSSDRVDVAIPDAPLVRRELFIGASRTEISRVRVDSTGRDTATITRVLRSGDGVLRGVVTAQEGGRALAGALVRVADGPDARANERGEFVITGAPAGTRMLEIRAVGFYPDRRAVHIAAAHDAALRIALPTLKAVLDTVKVRADRIADRHRSGFADRRKTGLGRFLTAEDIERRQPVYLSEIFRTLPGVQQFGQGMDSQVLVRGAFGYCTPTIVVNGAVLANFSANDLDMLVNPREVMGIEVYTGAMVPPQFQGGMTGCGSIVVWTK
jgi:hypothetical protein